MAAISVCLIGKESVIKEGVKSLLMRNDFDVTADYEDPSLIPSGKAENQQVHLVVSIDEGTDGLSGNVHKIKNIYAQSRIVVISGNVETSVIMAAFDAGVDGLILKDISSDGLIGSLKLAAAGEKVYPASMLMMPAANSNTDALTGATETYNLSRQELRIIHCLANGEPNKVIAHHLNITEATVKVHVRTILRKLGMTNRTKAAIFAISRGLAPTPQQQVAQAR
jgi:two-component system nitrate/nitrite response regulator NarL